ncbi:MAG: manganese efflux pump [Oscillospiraceae bacterium]
MSLGTLLLMALALSADALAVSVARGMSSVHRRPLDGLLTALLFGTAQALMPVCGYFGGQWLASRFIRTGGRLAASLLLALLGVRMMLAACSGEERSGPRRTRTGYARELTAQAVATSLDALAIGVGLAGMGEKIWPAALLIGAVTFLVCAAGYGLGQLGKKNCRAAQWMGGGILVMLAVQILLQRA